jgi:hypothetical protein
MDDDDEALYRAGLREGWGCELLVRTVRGQVLITTAMEHHYTDLPRADRNKVTRIMTGWCEGRPLTNEMFRNEGRSPKGVMLQAFKTWAHRLYGFHTAVDGIKSFVIVDCDPAKKRVDANQTVLNRAKGRVDAFGRGK